MFALLPPALPLAAAVCARHGIPFAAVNMINSGERYAYSFHLLHELAKRGIEVHQLHSDIMCKYAPWHVSSREALALAPAADCTPEQAAHHLALQRSVGSGSGAPPMRMVMAAMHGAAHSQFCQVRCFGALSHACTNAQCTLLTPCDCL